MTPRSTISWATLLMMLAMVRGQPLIAQSSLVEKAITETTELIMSQTEKQAARELAEMGGTAAAREVLERAAQEGGEDLVRSVGRYVTTYGPAALRAVGRSPARIIAVLDEIPVETRVAAIQELNRNPDVLMQLLEAHGKAALLEAARHPGVGAQLVQTLGAEGIEAGQMLTTDQAIILGRNADDIAALSTADKAGFWQAFKTAPGRVLDYLEQHPKILKRGTHVVIAGQVVTGVYAMRENLLGHPDDHGRGAVERTVVATETLFWTPISLILVVIALGVACWSGVCVWKLWRLAQITIRKQAQPDTSSAASGATPPPTRPST